MKSNFNVDIKFNADKILDVLSAGLRKYTDKIVRKDSDGSDGGRGQESGSGRDGYGSGVQRRSDCRNRR